MLPQDPHLDARLDGIASRLDAIDARLDAIIDRRPGIEARLVRLEVQAAVISKMFWGVCGIATAELVALSAFHFLG